MWLNCQLLFGWGGGGIGFLGGGLGGGTYQWTYERSIEEIDWGMEGRKSCPPTCNFVLITQESSSEDSPSPLSPLPSFTLLLYPPQPNIIWIASINAPHILTPSFLIHFHCHRCCLMLLPLQRPLPLPSADILQNSLSVLLVETSKKWSPSRFIKALSGRALLPKSVAHICIQQSVTWDKDLFLHSCTREAC